MAERALLQREPAGDREVVAHLLDHHHHDVPGRELLLDERADRVELRHRLVAEVERLVLEFEVLPRQVDVERGDLVLRLSRGVVADLVAASDVRRVRIARQICPSGIACGTCCCEIHAPFSIAARCVLHAPQ